MIKDKGMLIGGQWRRSDKALEVKSPYDGSVVGRTFLATDAQLEEALAASVASFGEIKGLPAYRRSEILRKVVNGLEEREKEIATAITLESGKPIKDARGEVRRAVNTFQLASEEAKRLGGEVIPLDISPGSEGRFAIVRRFPIGTVLGISPFNFPLNLAAHKVAPAMASGNPIILKPSPKTPISALLMGEIVTEAGWPSGGLNIVNCSNEQAQSLWQDERIKKLSFTGSAKVGWALKEFAGTRKVTLELGGNAGAIVHGDADLALAAARCAIGAFSNAGQVCISVQRIFVDRVVFDEFMDRYLDECRKIKMGDPLDEPTDLGPMIEEAAAIRTEQWIKEAQAEGARVLLGGKRHGSFMEPTVMTGTRPSMKVCGEEAFAPLVSIEPYDSFDEAIDLVNSGLYGLQAGLFTRDMGRIMSAFARLEVGGVVANDAPAYRVDNMPYGGVKMSGFGREGVRYAIEEMTEPRLLAVRC
ncbi:MAG TPA: aldehyde dehydrogenase [Deltaproteobacteria bacterium]|nr:MAG: aldehyde dehydrogenase [Deltaproteobacteria bacterium GWA2_55_82]OGQ63097.1 MAG: aldehyde dehydrogenase [Deltaproteobacteria bacterium RIFCSPLOWO2_02_FULL_55_12]OIJ73556.1 MAG: aldehyde dehydrogenase [Deltaproteobacteria bacterium GWC2_55_46]HBG47689.1 aldehyde dehydrogenase [Deltaproteobacteria bacterium]HCY12089.1 aldehyde dehydrogenase [Deltaproteobacteria bacterium]